MKKLQRDVLEQLVMGSSEPFFLARVDHPDWPVALCNPAFDTVAGKLKVLGEPLADVVEHLIGRDLALEISENVRGGHEASLAVEVGNREYLLTMKPIQPGNAERITHYGLYWSRAGGAGGLRGESLHRDLLKAKRRIRDLTRDDAVTGLLNARSFREVLEHDWAVAAREKASLALVSFTLDDFQAYLDVFGRHAADSCLRRVAQAIRRCLRRASDVAARIQHDDGGCLIVLSHSSQEDGVNMFAARISAAVRDLGLHHPRSSKDRFVTVSYKTRVVAVGTDNTTCKSFLDSVL